MAKHLPVDGYYGRWYRRDGQPIHETDIRTARKEGLIPGVSVIARVMAMPDLDSCKHDQLLSFAYSMMRDPVTGQGEKESTDEFLARVVEVYGEPLKQAAERESEIHDELQFHIEKPQYEDPDDYKDPVVVAVLRWIDSRLDRCWENGYERKNATQLPHSEDIVVNTVEGYAGMVDYWGPYGPEGKRKTAVVGFKSRKVTMSQYKKRRNKPQPIFYNEDCMQLAAYAEAIRFTYNLKKAPPIVSLVVSTNPDLEGVFPREWTEEEQERGLAMFRMCLSLWRLQNNFVYRETESHMVECSWCKTMESSKRKVRTDRAFYCKGCKQSGVRQRIAQRKYIEKLKHQKRNLKAVQGYN